MITIASLIPLSVQSLSLYTILALSQVNGLAYMGCDGRFIPLSLWLFPFFPCEHSVPHSVSTSGLCSFTLTDNFLLISPTQQPSHPWHLILYTPSLGSALSYRWTSRLLKVVWGHMAVLILLFFITCTILSDRTTLSHKGSLSPPFSSISPPLSLSSYFLLSLLSSFWLM